AAAARRAAGPRAGPRAAARLPRQPAANGGRDAALLPSRGVVGLDAGARGARALLRRPGGRRLWRRACLRDGPAQDGATARRVGAAFPDAETVRVLAAIARRAPNEHVMREALETLGRMKNGAGLPVVIDIARTHPNPDVRREAVESIRDEAPRAISVPILREIARRDRDPDVHRKAAHALAKLDDSRRHGARSSVASSSLRI